MTIPDPPPRIDTEAKDFLLKEFEVVRTEHDALDARLVTIIQYLLLFSATIYYFLLTTGCSIAKNYPMEKVIVWSLPTIASIIAAVVLFVIAYKIDKIDAYLYQVECVFVNSTTLPKDLPKDSKFGWEHFRSFHGAPKATTLIKWIATVIMVLNGVALVVGFWTSPASDACATSTVTLAPATSAAFSTIALSNGTLIPFSIPFSPLALSMALQGCKGRGFGVVTLGHDPPVCADAPPLRGLFLRLIYDEARPLISQGQATS